VKPRFQADNDLRSSIRAGVLRHERSVDFQSARAARLDALPDPEVLHLAAVENRILVSHDENTMPAHFRDFLSAGNRWPGVLMVPQGASVGSVIESILLIWIASGAEEWVNRIAWLPL
jgi:predicted nuclease of predicted toxin-antitoxin system